MFLKELRIENANNVIRKISFRKGINLIIDETKADSEMESGNNVGKTTVIRLIDFCLGGSGENIYKDTEFKDKTNKEIEHFLKTSGVLITLILKDDLEIEKSQEIIIERNFLLRKEMILKINGEQYKKADFPEKLKKMIFPLSEKKPTFRQIIAKNIRDEKNRLHNVVKVLNPFTKQEEYETLYYFWLGVVLKSADRKHYLNAELQIEKNLQSKLNKETPSSQIEQSLFVIDRKILELQEQKKSLNVNKNFENDIDILNGIKSEINTISTNLNRLEFRKALIEETQADLRKQSSIIDTESVKRIYEEAKAFMPDIQKSFEDTLKFHNEMIESRITYIKKDFPNLLNDIDDLKRKRKPLLIKEKELTKKIQSSKIFPNLEKIITELNKNHELKGQLSELQRLREESLKRMFVIDEELKSIDEDNKPNKILINSRIAEFNKYFSAISDSLYQEQFVLSPVDNIKGQELSISAISGNPGTGKKKVQIAAFDLAYIQFADAIGIPCLRFIVHDQIENIHGHQLSKLLKDIVDNINCQYVLPVLKDKLPPDIDIAGNTILSLSQDSKLFKI